VLVEAVGRAGLEERVEDEVDRVDEAILPGREHVVEAAAGVVAGPVGLGLDGGGRDRRGEEGRGESEAGGAGKARPAVVAMAGLAGPASSVEPAWFVDGATPPRGAGLRGPADAGREPCEETP